MPTLIGLSYSPWTEKARWALAARGVSFVYRSYQPLLGEPELRWRLNRWFGNVSVPVLLDDGGEAISDSTRIARWAAEHGSGPVLFPPEHQQALADVCARSERALDAGRTLSLQRTLGSNEALRELVPGWLRGVLGPVAPLVGRVGVLRTVRKYAHGASHPGGALRAELDWLRAQLGAAGGAHPRTLLGAFSFADIAASAMLAFVTPPRFGVRIGDASRASFTDPALATEYSDLLAWRDALYEAHRPR